MHYIVEFHKDELKVHDLIAALAPLDTPFTITSRHISLEAAEQKRALDLLPCGHHKDALVDNGDRQWCVACESASQ